VDRAPARRRTILLSTAPRSEGAHAIRERNRGGDGVLGPGRARPRGADGPGGPGGGGERRRSAGARVWPVGGRPGRRAAYAVHDRPSPRRSGVGALLPRGCGLPARRLPRHPQRNLAGDGAPVHRGLRAGRPRRGVRGPGARAARAARPPVLQLSGDPAARRGPGRAGADRSRAGAGPGSPRWARARAPVHECADADGERRSAPPGPGGRSGEPRRRSAPGRPGLRTSLARSRVWRKRWTWSPGAAWPGRGWPRSA
jgi:hypothetical protein